MKKRIFVILSMLIIAVLILSACSESLVSSESEIYADGSGTRVITIRIFGDEEALPFHDYTAGNNTAFLLSTGDALVKKLDEFCPVDDVAFAVIGGGSKKESTYITMTIPFTSIDDYNTKCKVIAGDYANLWVDATLEKDGANFTYTERLGNMRTIYLDILEQYFNDFDCYPVYEYGPDTRSQIIPDGIQFSDGPISEGGTMMNFEYWIIPSTVTVKIGDEEATKTIVNGETLEFDAKIFTDDIVLSGTPKKAPETSSDTSTSTSTTSTSSAASGCGSSVSILACSLVVIGAAIIIGKRDKR